MEDRAEAVKFLKPPNLFSAAANAFLVFVALAFAPLVPPISLTDNVYIGGVYPPEK